MGSVRLYADHSCKREYEKQDESKRTNLVFGAIQKKLQSDGLLSDDD